MNPMRGVVLCAAVLLACGEAPSDSPPPLPNPAQPPAPPPGIRAVVVSPNGMSIAVGDSLQFHASTTDGTIIGFTWAVDRTDLAGVDTTGLVKALKAGAVQVRACGKPAGSVCGGVTLMVQ